MSTSSYTIPPGFRARPDLRDGGDDVAGFMAKTSASQTGTFTTEDGTELGVTIYPVELEPEDGDIECFLAGLSPLSSLTEAPEVEGFKKPVKPTVKPKHCTDGTFCSTDGVCVPMTICI